MVWKVTVGMKLRHKYHSRTAEVVKVGEVFAGYGVPGRPFKTLVTIKAHDMEHTADMDLSALRSYWKPLTKTEIRKET